MAVVSASALPVSLGGTRLSWDYLNVTDVAIARPSGTVTFLFTDIVGSTSLWDAYPSAMAEALALHDGIIRRAIDRCGGHLFATGGDGFAAAFGRASDAVVAAIEAQRELCTTVWPDPAPLSVRMGLHTGEAEERDGDYFGTAVNRAARLMGAAHGGQVVVSGVTASLVDGVDDVQLVDLGSVQLRGVNEPIRAFGVASSGYIWIEKPLVSHQANAETAPRVDLVGRESELADLVSRVRERRLVTVTGPGGIGKTTLSGAAVELVGPEFEYGAIVVDLTRIDTSAGVAEAVAHQLGAADFESLLNSPSDQPALIVFDNCEHVLDAAADVIAMVLDACAMPSVLATSRSPLDLPGESVLNIGPLEVPIDEGADVAAVVLFEIRAADNGAVLVPEDRSTVAEIVRRLDGVPLAIELAAARLRTRSLVELLAELDARPHELARPRYRGRPSHRSVADMVGWSTDLLNEDLQKAFRRLGVFSGPFTGSMAAAVIDPEDRAATPGRIDELIAASLVVADTTGDVTWYRMLHPVRAMALENVRAAGEVGVVESRLVDHVVELAINIIANTASGWDGSVLTDLLALYDHIVASIRWALANDESADRAFLLVAVSWGIVHQAHTAELAQLAEQALIRWPDPTHAGWPDAAATAATCRNLLGDVEGAIELAERALPHADVSPFAPASLRRVLAQAHRAAGRFEDSRDWFAAGADAATAAGSNGMAWELLVDFGLVAAELGDARAGEEAVDRALQEAEAAGSRINAAWALAGRGALALRSDPGTSLLVIEQAIDAARTIGYPAGLSFSLRAKAVAELRQGLLDDAATTLLELLFELLQRGGLNDLRIVLDPAAELFKRTGTASWADLAVTAASLPVTSVAVPVESTLFEHAAGTGRVLASREAYVACRVGLQALIDGRDSPAPIAAAVDGPSLRMEGDAWRVTWGLRTFSLRVSKGVEDLATLLEAPGREFACVDLAGALVVPSGGDDVIDPTARRQYESRIRDLQEDLEEAERNGDLARAEQSAAELDALVEHLSSALGLGGATRKHSNEAERARSAVTQRLRSTLKKIATHDPALGRHLSDAVNTGTFCCYAPAEQTVWTVSR